MFTLLTANIQGETLICVSNSDGEGARTQLRLQDRDGSLIAALPRYVPASPGSSSGGTPQRLCYAGGGREWGGLLHKPPLVCTEFNGGLLF